MKHTVTDLTRSVDDLSYRLIHISHDSAGWQSAAKVVLFKKGFGGVRNRLTLVEMPNSTRFAVHEDVFSAMSFEKFITGMFLLELFAKGLDRSACAYADSVQCTICYTVSYMLQYDSGMRKMIVE